TGLQRQLAVLRRKLFDGRPQQGNLVLVAARMGFSAYGVTQGDDPISQAMRSLIDNAAGHEHQIALLWAAIEKLAAQNRQLPLEPCVPQDAATQETFDAEGLRRKVN
ncbi:MAG: hypothetical protein ACKOGB_04995, partial [Betaproteobacteria bacterium]